MLLDNRIFTLILLLPLSILAGKNQAAASSLPLAPSYLPSAPGLIWATWGGPLHDQGNDIATDASGNIYIVGTTEGSVQSSQNALILKYDANGSLLWVKTWGIDSGLVGKAIAMNPKKVVVDSSGEIYAAGDAQSFNNASAIFLTKFNPSGNLIWQKTWGGDFADHVNDIAIDASGEVYLTGSTATLAGPNDLFLLKFNSTSSLLWQDAWGGDGFDEGDGIATSSSGDIFLTGFSQSLGSSEAAILLKFNSTGSLLGEKAWNDSLAHLGLKVAITSGNDVYVAGSTKGLRAGEIDTLVMKFNSTGHSLWQRSWSSNSLGGNRTSAEGVVVKPGGNIVVSGFTNGSTSMSTNDRPFILELNSSGNYFSSIVIGYGPGRGLGVTTDLFGNIIATGYVDQLPPSFYAGSSSLIVLNFNLTVPILPARPLFSPVGDAYGTIRATTGTQDQFYGSAERDVLLLKEFSNPTTFPVTFSGLINSFWVNSTYQPLSDHTENITEGTYISTALVHVCGYCYGTAWNSSGEVRLVNTYGGLLVTVTVLGPGTLSAFDIIGPGETIGLPPGLLGGSMLLTAMIVISIIASKRRKVS